MNPGSPLKICLVHNFYGTLGGEDTAYLNELELLRRHGHDVITFERHNRDIVNAGIIEKIGCALRTPFSVAASHAFVEFLQGQGALPDVVHAHNTFPQITPSLYQACARLEVPVVQTLHNHRLICPAASLFRDLHPCTDCLGRRVPWPATVHGCYRDSVLASVPPTLLNSIHNAMGTWQQKVDAFISPSVFSRDLFIEHGLAAERIHVKPNFVWPLDLVAPSKRSDHWLFVGRRTQEKGLGTLLRAWRACRPGRLLVIGDGPIEDPGIPGVEFLGQRSHEETRTAISTARAMIVPSEAPETFGLVVLEAFAAGVPVVASRRGALRNLVEDHRTGRLFEPGDAGDLSRILLWAVDHPDPMERFGDEGLRVYQTSYAPQANHDRLVDIYKKVIRAT